MSLILKGTKTANKTQIQIFKNQPTKTKIERIKRRRTKIKTYCQVKLPVMPSRSRSRSERCRLGPGPVGSVGGLPVVDIFELPNSDNLVGLPLTVGDDRGWWCWWWMSSIPMRSGLLMLSSSSFLSLIEAHVNKGLVDSI